MHKKIIRAQDVMQKNFVEIDGLATVADAIHSFNEHNIGLLIIKKRDEFDAHGVVLLSDVVKKVLAKDRAIERVNLYEIMSKPVVSVEPSMDIRYCARLMSRFGLSHAVVQDSGDVVGVLGYRELIDPWIEADD